MCSAPAGELLPLMAAITSHVTCIYRLPEHVIVVQLVYITNDMTDDELIITWINVKNLRD